MDEHRTLRYMTRFRCIGPECEDNCCYGWQVDIDPVTYKKLIAASRLTEEVERKRLRAAIRIERKDRMVRRLIRLRPDGLCPMLEPDGLCHIHGRYGEGFLPDVCTTFPRAIHQVGESLELTGMASCPEVSRQLLLYEDAVEDAPLDPDSLSRIVRGGGLDPRDIRPYFRLMLEVRGYLFALLRERSTPLEERLFLSAFFAKRTAPVLKRDLMKGDIEAVRSEMASLARPETRQEIGRRFAALEAPNALVPLLAREMLRAYPNPLRDRFRQTVDEVFRSYVELTELVADPEHPTVPVESLWDEYRRRKARVRERGAARVDLFLANFAVNFWMHHLPTGSPDLFVHNLRLLGEMAVQKFLLYSHPMVQKAVEQPDESFFRTLDAVAVDVFYKVARQIEHTPLLSRIEEALQQKELRSMAGAVYLVRF
jgi:lysine-N-methylase